LGINCNWSALGTGTSILNFLGGTTTIGNNKGYFEQHRRRANVGILNLDAAVSSRRVSSLAHRDG